MSIERDGEWISAGGPRQAAVLSVLALSVARPVSVSRLVDAVWGDEPPNSVSNVIQVYISALRKLLRPIDLNINRAGSTYMLAAALDDIDVDVFQRYAAEGRAALRSTDNTRALGLLQRAADLWNPVAFAGLDDCAFAGPARAALLASGLAVATDRGTALCALGLAEQAVAAAEGLVEEHPFHEPAWDLLMRALYHSGRQHDALEAFMRARSMFVEELGLDPPPALVELEGQILDRSLAPVSRTDDRAETATTLPNHPARLPALPAGVVGRTAEIDRVVDLLKMGERTVTLVGLGGIGKTTMALAIGHRLADDGYAVAFVELADVVEPSGAVERMCDVAGVGAGDDRMSTLAATDPDLTLILDNVEQIGDLSAMVARLMATTSRLRLLITSRVALRIRAEQVVPVGPLDTATGSGADDAASLFVQRARRVKIDAELVPTQSEVREICELAGGIPLAIEVAAGQLGHLTVTALLDRLRRHREFLLDGGTASDLPDRQANLRTVLDTTVSLIDGAAARLGRRWCLLRGAVGLGMIGRFCADEPGLLDHLEELVDAGLVNGPDPAGRYRMPIPVCEYFAADHDDLTADGDRLMMAVLDLAESLATTNDENGRWAEGALVDETCSIAVACELAVARRAAETGARLAVALRRYWLLSSRLRDASQYCEELLRLELEVSHEAAVTLLAGQFAAMLNRADAADLLVRGLDLAATISGIDPFLVVNSWCYLGSWYCDHDDFIGARRAQGEVEELTGRANDRALVELGLDFGAYITFRLGDFAAAVRLVDERLADARRDGSPYVIVDLLHRNAENLLELGRPDDADVLVAEAMEIARITPIGPMAAKVFTIRAVVDIEQGRPAAAIGAGVEALRLTAGQYPDPATQATVLRVLGAARACIGDVVTAARCDLAAGGILRRAGLPDGAAPLIDRRLDAVRRDPRARAAAGAAALDPHAVVEELLARADW